MNKKLERVESSSARFAFLGELEFLVWLTRRLQAKTVACGWRSEGNRLVQQGLRITVFLGVVSPAFQDLTFRFWVDGMFVRLVLMVIG